MKLKKLPNLNHLWAALMVEELVRCGADTFCVSPGSRSAPLAVAVAQNSRVKSFVHFDERACAFRALGISAATRKPSVIVTTSGTAAANLFPAVVEASKRKIPLLILTADRPPELRFTGAHQTIDQVKLFGDYARWHFDFPCPSEDIAPEFILTTIDQAVSRAQGFLGGPVHLNCMYREPLAPVKRRAQQSPYFDKLASWQKNRSPYTRYVPTGACIDEDAIAQAAREIKSIKAGIIAVGKLGGADEREGVLKLARKLNWPVFADVSSGLRLGGRDERVIHYFDQILLSKRAVRAIKPDGVLHLGGRLTSSRWYDFISAAAPRAYIMGLNHPLRSDPLHQVSLRIQGPIGHLCSALMGSIAKRHRHPFLTRLKEASRLVDAAVEQFFAGQKGLTEAHVARLVTQSIPAETAFFIASSMPIRDVDRYGQPGKSAVVTGANRGASGIDGTLATAAGFSTALNKPLTVLIGDLAFLHDLNSLAMYKGAKHPSVIVVLNNNGGGIFSFLPISSFSNGFERFFGTPHGLSFEDAASLFGLKYARPQTHGEFLKCYGAAIKGPGSTIIEIKSDRDYNHKVHRDLEGHIQRNIQRIFT